MDLQTFCRNLPKIELHAHLNGSLSPKTMQKLGNMHNLERAEYALNISECATLEECFKIFSIAHSLTTTKDAVYVAACDVIEEFSNDNVIYLELRSTPRASECMTKMEYIEAIINAIRTCEIRCSNILVKLLISIDRKHGYKVAEEHVQVAMESFRRYPKFVVGIDLSGDPQKGDAFVDLLSNCRKAGLRIAAHCAEIPNETEVIDILKFQPDRLGHCTCVHSNLKGSESLFQMLLESRIPVELCLSSNVKCGTVSSYKSHQFKYLYKVGHPTCISTDDKGVFNTTLSKEFELAAVNFHLNGTQLKDICKKSVEYSFASTEEKERLLSIVEEFSEDLIVAS